MDHRASQNSSTAVKAAETGTIITRDGVSLTYSQQGPDTGKQILFISGWRQTAAEWKKQVSHFTEAGYRVTTYDMRGHGESAKPTFGYRISRFATDLNDLLTKLHLKDLIIVAHSMGCCVAWAWWDQYPESHKLIQKLVLVDQSADFVIDPNWPDGKADDLAAIFTPDSVYNTAHNMTAATPPLVKSMMTSSVSQQDYNWILEQNRKISDENAGSLLIDHAFNDWRDVLPRINVPTLVIAGAVSIFPAVGVEWVASQIPGAKHYTFSAEEKGSHLMFWENAARFNSVVEAFLHE
ncbi:AB hydrolase superfamily [Fusarium beomiforme]|uniref:AB hydrolase superfamily n=1 Tax=Fusarium beomiforme TaxID=44412 RepID=A0A9P5AVK8_9HYPO|nr:AB hydrolase superfamily [Fusarium beomiforme]